MPTDVAHRRWWQIFEVVFGIPFLAAIALQWAVPSSLRHAFLTPASVPGGAALIIVDTALVVLVGQERVYITVIDRCSHGLP